MVSSAPELWRQGNSGARTESIQDVGGALPGGPNPFRHFR